MKESILEQLEFERQKRDVIKTANLRKQNATVSNDVFEAENSHKFAWEYEIEKYRKDQSKHRFYMIGALCGILSLLWNIWSHIPFLNALIS